jgi:glutamate--cysteine ligase
MASFKSSSLSKKYSREVLLQARAELDSLVKKCGMPIYSSIDLRDSGNRLVAVDVNLFPAGFNNLSTSALETASEEFKKFFGSRIKEGVKWKIGLLPESHTNNEGYLRNVATLQQAMQNAGAEVKLAWTGLPIPKPWELRAGEGKLTYFPAAEVTEWADALVLNHDLSGGPLESILNFSKPIFPSPELGWYKRKKSGHFEIAKKILTRVSGKVAIDPNDFMADSISVGDLNFENKEDVQRLIEEAARFFDRISAKNQDPFVYMKNDSGTYGLGIWSFNTVDELKGAAKLIQKRFQRGKQGAVVKQVILQEGIRTRFVETGDADKIEFEPVVYSVNGKRIGGFLRCGVTEEVGAATAGQLNLNRPNAWFEDESRLNDELPAIKDLYCFVMQLHCVAAALEDCPCESNK